MKKGGWDCVRSVVGLSVLLIVVSISIVVFS